MSVYEELRELISRLNAAGLDYALCGGLAMAAHGWPRATMDIDLLILESDYTAVRDVARESGFDIENPEFTVAGGKIRIRRLVKIAGAEAIPLDLIVVGPLTDAVWQTRRKVEDERGPVWVVSPDGLLQMKRLRGSKQDLADIERIEGGNETQN